MVDGWWADGLAGGGYMWYNTRVSWFVPVGGGPVILFLSTYTQFFFRRGGGGLKRIYNYKDSKLTATKNHFL